MTVDDVQRFTRAQPFVPFRVTFTDGSCFLIRWPDQCVAGSGRVFIPEVCRVAGTADFGSVAFLSLENVLGLEKLPDRPVADTPILVVEGTIGL